LAGLLLVLAALLWALVNYAHTPDLLANALVIPCLRAASGLWHPKHTRHWLTVGACLAGAAWAKAAWVYVLPVVCAIVSLLRWRWQHGAGKGPAHPLNGVKVPVPQALLLVAVWAGLLGVWLVWRYRATGQWGFSTAGPYNLRLTYEWAGNHPFVGTSGLLAPPSAWASLAWENIAVYDFGPAGFTGSSLWQGVLLTAQQVLWSAVAFGWGVPLLFGSVVWLQAEAAHRRSVWRQPLTVLVVGALGATAAFATVVYDFRYVALLSPIAWAWFCAVLPSTHRTNRWKWAAALGITFLLAAAAHSRWGTSGLVTGYAHTQTRDEATELLAALQPAPSARWASLEYHPHVPYRANGTYWGCLNPHDPDSWHDELTRCGIRYFLYRGEEPRVGFEGHYERVSAGGWTVYLLY
jgi:hypothetical protein